MLEIKVTTFVPMPALYRPTNHVQRPLVTLGCHSEIWEYSYWTLLGHDRFNKPERMIACYWVFSCRATLAHSGYLCLSMCGSPIVYVPQFHNCQLNHVRVHKGTMYGSAEQWGINSQTYTMANAQCCSNLILPTTKSKLQTKSKQILCNSKAEQIESEDEG